MAGGVKDVSAQLFGAGNTDAVRFGGGVKTGVLDSDLLGAQKPQKWTISNITAAQYSAVAMSFVANGSQTTVELRDTLTQLLRDLARRGIIEITSFTNP